MPQKGPASFPLTVLTLTLHLFRLRVASQLHLNNFESPLHHLTSARLQDDTRQNASLWMSQLVSPWEVINLLFRLPIWFNDFSLQFFPPSWNPWSNGYQALSFQQTSSIPDLDLNLADKMGIMGIISLKFQRPLSFSVFSHKDLLFYLRIFN